MSDLTERVMKVLEPIKALVTALDQVDRTAKHHGGFRMDDLRQCATLYDKLKAGQFVIVERMTEEELLAGLERIVPQSPDTEAGAQLIALLNAIESIAFEIPPVNTYTPRIVERVIAARDVVRAARVRTPPERWWPIHRYGDGFCTGPAFDSLEALKAARSGDATTLGAFSSEGNLWSLPRAGDRAATTPPSEGR